MKKLNLYVFLAVLNICDCQSDCINYSDASRIGELPPPFILLVGMAHITNKMQFNPNFCPHGFAI